MVSPETGRFSAYGSDAAVIGATFEDALPCCRTRMTTAAITTTTAAAIASGSQFRSRVSLEGIRSGPLLTSGFYTCYERNTGGFPFSGFRCRIFRIRTMKEGYGSLHENFTI